MPVSWKTSGRTDQLDPDNGVKYCQISSKGSSFWRSLCWLSCCRVRPLPRKTPASAQRIDTFLSAAEPNHFSGAVLVAKGDEVLFSRGYGYADYESGVKVSPETVFNIGSVTKQFTAAAVLKLVEQDKLRLGDTLGDLFDGVPEDKAGITVHQLLTHTAGISRQDLGFRYDQASKEDFLTAFFASTLATEPGTRHTYANTGYILLAAIVEQVSGQPFEDYLQQYLLEPAGLSQTGYLLPDWRAGRIANGYYFDLETAAWKSWGTTFQQWGEGPVTWFGIGKGDLHSTTGDLYNWHKALRDGDGVDSGKRCPFPTRLMFRKPKTARHSMAMAGAFRTRMMVSALSRTMDRTVFSSQTSSASWTRTWSLSS
jgi:CubicO group peptidase (beta-lactamase class C family)